jgi:hypothetical protein
MVEDGKCPDSKEDLVSAAVNTTDALKATNKEKLRLRKANDLAYSMLTICVKDPVSFGAVYNAISTDLPDGNAALALANLDKIFKLKSMATKHELEQQFNHSGLMKEDKNPDEWFAELDKIQLQLMMDYKVDYDYEKMISHILYNIKPKIYDTVLTVIKR